MNIYHLTCRLIGVLSCGAAEVLDSLVFASHVSKSNHIKLKTGAITSRWSILLCDHGLNMDHNRIHSSHSELVASSRIQ